MLKSIFCACLFIVLATQTLEAQKQNPSKYLTADYLSKNPNILWVGETQEPFFFDTKNPNKTYSASPNRFVVETIKLIDTRKTVPYYFREREHLQSLSQKILNPEFLKKNTVFQDAACTLPLSAEKAAQLVIHFDTLETFDPITFEPSQSIIQHPLNPDDVTDFKVQQRIFFDQKTNTFGSLVTSIAPFMNYYDDNGNFSYSKPLFWIKIDNHLSFQDLHQKDITWAKRSRHTLKMTACKSIKTTTIYPNFKSCVAAFIDEVLTNPNKNQLYSYSGALLTETQKKEILTDSTSTIIFKPETHESIVEVVHHKINPEHIQNISFVHEWYWDEKLQKLNCFTHSFALVLNRYDYNGNILNSGDIFWKAAAP